jgi:hypothetical protein
MGESSVASLLKVLPDDCVANPRLGLWPMRLMSIVTS